MANTAQRQTFIDQFVNAVYGILLGYGFCNAIHDIQEKEGYEVFHIAVVLFSIIVLCVHWWDWVSEIGKRVRTTVVEFSIDIAILLNLEWLFFEYDSIAGFSFLMSLLALLNFVWVVAFRIQKFVDQRQGFCAHSIHFWRYMMFRRVFWHVFKRFCGVILYSSICLVYYLSSTNLKTYESYGPPRDVIFFVLIATAFIIDREILYKNRFHSIKKEQTP